jgi:hypothetical protein
MAEMNDDVRKYLSQKYADQLDQLNSAQAFANLGDVIAGNKVGSQNPFYDSQRKTAEGQTLDRIDKYDKFKAQQAQAQDLAQYRQEQLAQQKTIADMNDARMREIANENRRQRANEDAAKAEEKKSKAELINAPQARAAKLPSGDKARLDNALMALKGLNEMGQALDSGENTFNLIGDNNYTAAERRATEAYGRMQSGGAINKEEEKRFNQTLPGAMDKSLMQRKKIIDQQNEMVSRIRTLGFEPKDFGVEIQSFNYGNGPQTKTINGVNYQKVDGGWQKVSK